MASFEVRPGDVVTDASGTDWHVLATGPAWLTVEPPNVPGDARALRLDQVRSRRIDFARDFATDGSLSRLQAALRAQLPHLGEEQAADVARAIGRALVLEGIERALGGL